MGQSRRIRMLTRPRPYPVGAGTKYITSAVNSSQGKEERACRDMIRAQLLHVLNISNEETNDDKWWQDMQLFPGSNNDDSNSDEACHSPFGSTDTSFCADPRDCCVEGFGNSIGHCSDTRSHHGSPRLQSRDVNSYEIGRRWLGTWPEGDDDCCGDGDGYLTLRPFPRQDALSLSEQLHRTRVDAATSVAVSDVKRGQEEFPSSSSPPSRILGLFRRLQPARMALKLERSTWRESMLVKQSRDATKPAGGGEKDEASDVENAEKRRTAKSSQNITTEDEMVITQRRETTARTGDDSTSLLVPGKSCTGNPRRGKLGKQNRSQVYETRKTVCVEDAEDGERTSPTVAREDGLASADPRQSTTRAGIGATSGEVPRGQLNREFSNSSPKPERLAVISPVRLLTANRPRRDGEGACGLVDLTVESPPKKTSPPASCTYSTQGEIPNVPTMERQVGRELNKANVENAPPKHKRGHSSNTPPASGPHKYSEGMVDGSGPIRIASKYFVAPPVPPKDPTRRNKAGHLSCDETRCEGSGCIASSSRSNSPNVAGALERAIEYEPSHPSASGVDVSMHDVVEVEEAELKQPSRGIRKSSKAQGLKTPILSPAIQSSQAVHSATQEPGTVLCPSAVDDDGLPKTDILQKVQIEWHGHLLYSDAR